MKNLTLALLLFAAASQAKSGDLWESIADIDATRAAHCDFLGDVVESKRLGIFFAAEAVKIARDRVRREAAERGATHVLWMPLSSAGMVQTASGKAYRCEIAETD